MAPPQLAGNTPILQIAHPGKVGVFPLFGDKLDGPVFDSLDCRFGERFDRDKPLIRQ